MDQMLPRLATFGLLPLTITISISTLALARLGFYYSSARTIVCFRCRQTFGVDELSRSLERHAQCCSTSDAATTAAQQQTATSHCSEQSQNLRYPATFPEEVPNDRSSPPPSRLMSGNKTGSRDNTLGGNTNANISKEYAERSSVTPILRNEPDFERLKDEAVRLSTFFDWPERVTSIVRPGDIAKAGLFYTGQTDRVQCAFCRGYLRNWVQGDIPAEEHRRLFPDCPFVRQLNGDNFTAAKTSSMYRVG